MVTSIESMLKIQIDQSWMSSSFPLPKTVDFRIRILVVLVFFFFKGQMNRRNETMCMQRFNATTIVHFWKQNKWVVGRFFNKMSRFLFLFVLSSTFFVLSWIWMCLWVVRIITSCVCSDFMILTLFVRVVYLRNTFNNLRRISIPMHFHSVKEKKKKKKEPD